MHDELAALEELQTLDLTVLKHRNELAEIPKNLEEMRADVAHVGDILQKEKARLEEAEQWRRDREKEIALHADALTRSKSKLMSARNEKESKAAQREIDTVRKMIQEREEESLKIMEAIEQYRSAIKEHAAEFAELESHLRASEEESQIRLREVQERIDKSAALRRELAGRVPEKTLKVYERVHRRLGLAVSEVVNGHCSGCNMDLAPQMYIDVQRGDTIYQCTTCKRLLLYKPPIEDLGFNQK